MAKDYLERHASELMRFEHDEEPLSCDDMEARARINDGGSREAAPDSLICPETGQVSLHDVSDLRAQLEQFRLGRGPSLAPVTSEVRSPKTLVNRGPVVIDDELQGRDGEWLVVVDATPDGNVLTLLCYESGTLSKRTASAVHGDVQNHRLKVHRYGMPDVPPELEGEPQSCAGDTLLGW